MQPEAGEARTQPDNGGGEPSKEESRGDKGKQEFSWLDTIRAGAQLTLDIIRVLREATDLYRKLFPAKGGLAA
jgi:hypothetical protein